jgi:protein-arginine kinase activator protein McsA
MEYTFNDLKHMNVSQLRDIAKEIDHEAVQGYTQLNKDHLLEAICNALHIDMHVHHEVVGIDKTKIKKQIKELKKQREEILAGEDKSKLPQLRDEVKKLKNQLRAATV